MFVEGVDELSRWWKSGDLNICLAFIDSMRVKSAELKDFCGLSNL